MSSLTLNPEIHKELVHYKIAKELVENPIFFIEYVFNEKLWKKQKEIAIALKKYKKVAVYSCYGTGKSFIASRLAIWFHQTHPNSIVGTTAPSFRQVKNVIWREIHTAYQKARIKLLGEPTSVEWNINRGKWYAVGVSARNIDSMQGVHSDYILAVIDEASGVPDEIISAMESWGAGGEFYCLMIGNPLRPTGKFYKTLFDPTFYKVKISAFDTPNFTGEPVPESIKSKLINQKFVREVELKYGKDSAFYKVAVLGEFPDVSSDSLFNVKDVEYCMSLKPEDIYQTTDDIYITCDPARFGSDDTVITIWKGFACIDYYTYNKIDLTALVGKILNLADKFNAKHIVIDTVGYGGGVFDLLKSKAKDKKFKVYSVSASESAFEEDKYADVRTEMYFNLANLVKSHSVKLPNDERLKEELMALTYGFDTYGRFKLVSKDKIKERIGRSPDFADAVALRFAVLTQKIGVAFI